MEWWMETGRALCGLLGETSAEGAGELYRVLAEAADDEGGWENG